MGAAYAYRKYRGAHDLAIVDDELRGHVGAEAELHELLTLRAGYMVNYDTKNESIKLESEVLYAELDEEARLSFDKKPTESQVRQFITRTSRYQELERKSFKTKYNFNLMNGVMKALEHKKSSWNGWGVYF